jgi:crossover junction endodeoxyribonuclease RusA
MQITMQLPEPPSANRIWRNGRGRTYLSQAAKDFKAAVLAAALMQRIDRPIFHGPVKLTMTWFRKRKAGDLSNRIKVVEDALNGVVWDDDKQVTEIHVYRVDAVQVGRLDVTVADV